MADARNAQQEATDLVGDGHVARVLEPSPPAVDDGEAFADDPPARGAAGGLRVVSPVAATGDVTWADWVTDHPEHATFAGERWLAAYPRLGAPPADFVATREALHTLATNIVTPARYRANGKIGLRWTRGGFGTPFFGDDRQVRVEGTELVVQHGDHVHAETLSTVGAAARLVLGQEVPDLQWAEDLHLQDVPATADPGMRLEVDAAAVAYLGNWYGFAYACLETLRHDAASDEASRPQIWPEHFDPAIEVLPDKRRASYGFSPGDGGIPEPYVYVSVWYAADLGGLDGDLWNSDTFPGAALRISEVADVTDQVGHVVAWLSARRDALAGMTPVG